MKQHYICILSACIFLLATASWAEAALVTAHFTDAGNNQWMLDLSLVNSDLEQGANEFSVYFSESLFSNLAIIASPATWDSLVAQPDTYLASSGFFDSYSPQPLALGKTQSGFKLAFTFLGNGAPQPLVFDIFDNNFQIIASGNTVQTPEPFSLSLFFTGVFMAGAARLTRNCRRKG